MPEKKPPFDPNKPYQVADSKTKPPFDPNKPFEEVTPKPIESAYQKADVSFYGLDKAKGKVNEDVVYPWKNNENEGFGVQLLKSLNGGAAALESGILKAPAYIYDVFAAPFNYVMSGRMKDDLLMLPNVGENKELQKSTGMADYKPLSSENFAKEIAAAAPMAGLSWMKPAVGAAKQVVENLDAISQQTQQEVAQKYGTSISENFANGEYEKGLKLLALSVAESVPVTASLMIGNASGLTANQATVIGGAVFGAEKKAQLDEQFPEMPEEQKVVASLLSGLSEGYIESSFGLTKLGSEIANIFKDKGLEAGKEFAKRGFQEVYLPILKKYAGNYAEEVGSEMTTQYVQNAIDKYIGGEPDKNLFDGVVDAGLVAAGMTAPIGGATGVAELSQVKRGFKREQELQKQKYQERSDIAYKAVKDGSAEQLKTDLGLAKESGDLSEEEYNAAVFKIDSYNSYYEQAKDLGLDGEEEKEAFELSFQIDALQSEIPTNREDIEKLDPVAKAKINAKKELQKGLQKQLDDIVLKANVKKETKVGQETVNKVAKNEEPKEGETKLDDLLKKFGVIKPVEAEEVDIQAEMPKQREDITKVAPMDWNDDSKYTSLQRKQITQEALKTAPNNEFEAKLQEAPNKKMAVILPDGKKLYLAQSAPSTDPNAANYMKRENFPKTREDVTDESGQPLEAYKEPVRVKRVEIDAYDLETDEPQFKEDGSPKRKAVLSVYNPETGKQIAYVRELDAYKGKYVASKYSPTEKSQLNAIAEANHLNEEIEPFTYKAPSEATKQPKKAVETETVVKPDLAMEFITDKDALGKEITETIVEEEGGEELEITQKVAKSQSEIKREFELLKKLMDCIHG